MTKALIITGANGNVGSYLAHKFSVAGNNLILFVHQNTHRIADLAELDTVRIIQKEITDREGMITEFDRVINETGWIPEKLIHTATERSHDIKSLLDSDPDLWTSIIHINILGTYNILKCVLPHFRQNQRGKIVLFGSNVTRIGLPKGSAYAASKAAIANLGRTLAVEEAPHNIIINTVSPGPIKIDDSQFSESYRKFREEYYSEKLREIPLKRCASFQDIFGVCRFLLSDENSYITGEEFFITGGKI